MLVSAPEETAFLPGFLRRWLQHPWSSRGIILLAVLLSTPAFGVGWMLDDHMHHFMLEVGDQLPVMRRAPHQLYSFITGDPQAYQTLREIGTMPWYADPQIKATFWRPIASWLLWLDHELAPGAIGWAHLHSLLWLIALLLVVRAIYRRLFVMPWLAALATLLFAIDDAHAFPTVWAANRNALEAAVFAGLTLFFHLRWRQTSAITSAMLAPLSLAIGLLCSEIALSIVGYLVAYALFLEGTSAHPSRPPWLRRMLTLLPCGVVVLVWLVAYRMLGFGTHSSTLYIDPLSHPLAFFTHAGPRAAALLLGQLTPLSAESLFYLSGGGRALFTALALVLLGVIFTIGARLVRINALARFWFGGMILSTVPLLPVFSHDRVLLLVGIGGFGLIGQFLAGPAGAVPADDENATIGPDETYWRRPAVRRLALFLVITHLVLSPLFLPSKIYLADRLGGCFERAARTLDRVSALGEKMLIMVNGPDFFFTAWAPLIRAQVGLVAPRRIRILSTGISGVTVVRVDTRTVEIVAPTGFFDFPFDRILAAPGRIFLVGETHQDSEVSIQVMAVSADGRRPTALRCRFTRDLEDPSYVWTIWRPDGYHPFVPPAPGHQLTTPPTSLWQLGTL